MSDGQTDKPRFEPPPWEKEAFERFRAELDDQRKQAELDAALLEAQRQRERTEPPHDVAPAKPEEVLAPPPAGVAGEPPVAAPAAGSEAPAQPVISAARIDSMLIELRGEEPAPVRTSIALINTVIGGLVVAGLWIVIEAALLFSRTRAEGASGMLGAVASLVVLLTGIGFLAGGFLLFRKHHV